MTKGEELAYTTVCSALSSLISSVESYCRDYDCGSELMQECKEAKEAWSEAKKLFNKGKRKKK